MSEFEIVSLVSGIKSRIKSLRDEGVEFFNAGKKDAPESSRNESSIAENEAPLSSARAKRDVLIELKSKVVRCEQCYELASARKNVVFGAGNADAGLCFVGEAPGFEEDKQGLPFVGKAGQLLTKIIESIGLTRKQVFICNVLKCRPPKNRNPVPSEVISCEPYLIKQLEIIQPKVICALGKFAAQTLLKTDTPISKLRGLVKDYHGIKLVPTFHPAYLLRNPADKRLVWRDMKHIRELLKG